MKYKLLTVIAIAFLLLVTISTIASSPVSKEDTSINKVTGIKDYKEAVTGYINDLNVEAYRIDSRFFIPIEELQRFGFSANWDEGNKTLNLEHIALHSSEDEVPVLIPELDFSAENTSHISGKVKLPKGTVAPKGGYKITITASINPAPETNEILRGNHPIEINSINLTIPEGKNYIDYKIPVLLSYKEYKPAYFIFFSCQGIRTQNGFGNYPYTLDMSNGEKTNIDYTINF